MPEIVNDRTLSELDDDPARRFWSLCQHEELPELNGYLQRCAVISANHLIAILRIDQAERWSRGERIAAASYIERFAELRRDPILALELIYSEYLLREERGETPDVEEYASAYPAHAERIRIQVELHRALGRDEPAPAVPSSSRRPQIPGYEILGELGRGGMGVVYHAWQTRLNRAVALKMILSGECASPEQTLRFLTEAEAAARLQHPHIVAIHDVGEYEGYPFLALEFVKGGSLFDRLDGKPWPAREAARLIETVAHAIHAAHTKGIVHRDLKPANVLLTEEGEPKIADFGLAKLLGNDSGLTRTESILGSPNYMAPEQVGKQANEIGPTADVYSLGSILYELLTGRPPFRASSALETLELAKTREPQPPSRIQPGVPIDLETICLKCLEKLPARRYATAETLAEDLQRFRADEPILARRCSTRARVVRWARKNPAVAGMASVTFVLLLVTLTVFAWEWRQAEASLTREIANNIQLRLANARERASKQRAQERFALAIDSVKAYSKDAGEDALSGEGQREGLRKRRLAVALALFRKLREQAHDDVDAEQQADLAAALSDSAFLMWDIGANRDAEVAFLEAASIRKALLAASPRDVYQRREYAALSANLSNLVRAMGQNERALKLHEQALSGWQELLREDPENLTYLHAVSWAQGNLGAIRRALKDPRGSLAYHLQARETRLAMLRLAPKREDIRADLAWGNLDIALHHLAFGNPADAVRPAEEAVPVFRKTVAAHPTDLGERVRLARSLSVLSIAYHDTDRRSDAIASIRNSLDVWEKVCRDSPAVLDNARRHADDLEFLGQLEGERYRFDSSIATFKKAVALRESLYRRDPSHTGLGHQLAWSLKQLASALTDAGKPGEAVPLLMRSTGIYRNMAIRSSDARTEYRPSLILCLRSLAAAQFANGQASDALKSVEAARELASVAYETVRTASALRIIGELDEEIAIGLNYMGRQRESRAKLANVAYTVTALATAHRSPTDVRQLIDFHLSRQGWYLRLRGRTRMATLLAAARASLWPGDSREMYNAACEVSLCLARAREARHGATEQAAQSLLARRLLRRALRLGFCDDDLMRIDPDLDAIRGHAEFNVLLNDVTAVAQAR